MVFIKNDKIFAKVWKIDKREKYADMRISTSEKIEKDGNITYENSSWWTRVIGKAFNQLKDINEGDRVIITKAKMSNPPYEKDGKKRNVFKFTVLEFESKEDTKEDTKAPENESVDDSEENLPF